MSFYGDLSSFAIGDILQNIEGNRSSGTFTLRSPGSGTVMVHFLEGTVAMMAGEHRPPLMDSLVTAGLITPDQMRAVRTRRRGSRKSLVETLVSLRLCSEDQVVQTAAAIMREDLCDLIASAEGTFDFKEGRPPARTFDPEERRLNVRLAIGPLLLEAARRADHWEMIREVLPSDNVHFVAPKGVKCPADAENKEVVHKILSVLDGTRNVVEVTSLFHHKRFAAYQSLAFLVRERLVRAAESSDLVALAASMMEKDEHRARSMILGGLDTEPQHRGLLELEAQLAEKLDDQPGAAKALKMIAHLHHEQGDNDSARTLLEKAVKFSPQDTAIWERLLTLDFENQDAKGALQKGMKLVQLYRAPGLHTKAHDVLQRLLDLAPESVDLQVELARTLVDSDDSKLAIQELAKTAKKWITQQRYPEARRLYEEIVNIEPGHTEAAQCIERIDNQTYSQRRLRTRRVFRRTVGIAAMLLILAAVVVEGLARVDYADANSTISAERYIENQRYQEALGVFDDVAARHPFSLTRFFDIAKRKKDLQSKMGAPAAPQSPVSPNGEQPNAKKDAGTHNDPVDDTQEDDTQKTIKASGAPG